MMYRIVADIIVGIHLAYVSFVILGQLAIVVGVVLRWHWVRNRWFRWIHLLMIGFVALEAVVAMECPLTTWENLLRDRLWEREQPAAIATCVGTVPSTPVPLVAASLAKATENTQTSHTFIGRCLDAIMFPGWPPEVLNATYIGFALVVLATFVLAPPRRFTTPPHLSATP